MITSDSVKKDFSSRLHSACDSAGVRRRGRSVDIQKELKTKGVSVSTTAIGKWLNSEAVPDLQNVIILAHWLGVSPAWLQYGDNELTTSSEQFLSSQSNRVFAAKSQTIIDRITQAVADGRISSDDLELLNQIAIKFEEKNLPDNSHKLLRNKLSN